MASFLPVNPPDSIDMNSFWAAINDFSGPQRSCRYLVKIAPPLGIIQSPEQTNFQGLFADLSYLCEAAEFPGRGFNLNADIRYYGPSFKLPFQSTYDDITLTFLCRNESYERQLFDDWMEIINPSNTFDFNYAANYYSTIAVYSIGDDDTAHYEYMLEEAYPTMVNPQPIAWSDDNFLRLTVNFTYSKWKRPGRDEYPDIRTKLVLNARNSL